MIALPFQDRPPRDHLDQAGINAERQLAHYLCRQFADDPRVDLFFGLRIPLDRATGSRQDAAQMDALLIHCHGIAIIESKSVHDEVRVNKRGEWLRTWKGKARGMHSPVEQVSRELSLHSRANLIRRSGLRVRTIQPRCGHTSAMEFRSRMDRPLARKAPVHCPSMLNPLAFWPRWQIDFWNRQIGAQCYRELI